MLTKDTIKTWKKEAELGTVPKRGKSKQKSHIREDILQGKRVAEGVAKKKAAIQGRELGRGIQNWGWACINPICGEGGKGASMKERKKGPIRPVVCGLGQRAGALPLTLGGGRKFKFEGEKDKRKRGVALKWGCTRGGKFGALFTIRPGKQLSKDGSWDWGKHNFVGRRRWDVGKVQ